MTKQNNPSQHGSKLHVAIVGAGIGGLATALAMLRAGLEVDLYEQAHILETLGAGIHIGPNGARILLRFGLGRQIDAVAIQTVAEETQKIRASMTGSIAMMWSKQRTRRQSSKSSQ